MKDIAEIQKEQAELEFASSVWKAAREIQRNDLLLSISSREEKDTLAIEEVVRNFRLEQDKIIARIDQCSREIDQIEEHQRRLREMNALHVKEDAPDVAWDNSSDDIIG